MISVFLRVTGWRGLSPSIGRKLVYCALHTIIYIVLIGLVGTSSDPTLMFMAGKS